MVKLSSFSSDPSSVIFMAVNLIILAIIGIGFLIEGLTGIACIVIAILYKRRFGVIKSKLHVISQGTIKYPSLLDILDSFMVIEFLSLFWGSYVLVTYIIDHFATFNFIDGLRSSLLFSLLCFLVLVMIQQIFVSFLFSICVSHGFFLFSILPRFVSAIRTFFISFFWISAIKNLDFFSPILLEFVYIIMKGSFFLFWFYEATALLTSKDVPPEFKTSICKEHFQCPVCLENVKFYVTLPCMHSFCLTCFLKWGSIRLNCPVCRCNFSSWLHQVEFDPYNWFPFVIFNIH